MTKYSCEKCAKFFSQKSHYEKHLLRKKPCDVETDKIKLLIDKAIEEKWVDTNKKMSANVVQTEPQRMNHEVSPLCIEKHLKPIIKWSGGKSDEIKRFEQYFPEQFDTYIEPFVGGGSVFFYLHPKKAVISDVHKELIDLYRSIGKGKGADIYEFMQNTPNEEKTYYEVRDKMNCENELDKAKQFYYQRKTCFRGMLRYNRHGKFNIPFGRYKTINYEDVIKKEYETLLGRTEILNEKFEYLFEHYNNENNFMFLDPPYDSEFTDYGYCQFGKEEHQKLATLFKNTKIKCLMVIGKTPFIEYLYSGEHENGKYIADEYDKKYRFKLYDNRIGNEINTKHLIIKNY